MSLAQYRKVVAFGAHPDDLEVGAGGLLAQLVAQGAAVTMVVASIPNRFVVRRAEAIAGAARLGARLVLPPGDGENHLEELAMRELVGRFDRELADPPDLVICHGAHDVHWDHGLVHRAVLAALRRARCDVLAYATRLPLGAGSPPPTCIVDITTTIERKVAAIAEHASQFPPTFAATRREVASALGIAHGVAYAEAFEVLHITLR